jgi:hypothetical protein
VPTDADRVRRLAANAGALAEKVDLLVDRVEELHDDLQTQNKALARKGKWFWAGVALNTLLAAGFGWVVHDQFVTREQVLCPLYSIFVKSYNPNSLAAKAQGIEQYNRTFEDIRHQYDVLGCAEPVAYWFNPATGQAGQK